MLALMIMKKNITKLRVLIEIRHLEVLCQVATDTINDALTCLCVQTLHIPTNGHQNNPTITRDLLEKSLNHKQVLRLPLLALNKVIIHTRDEWSVEHYATIFSDYEFVRLIL